MKKLLAVAMLLTLSGAAVAQTPGDTLIDLHVTVALPAPPAAVVNELVRGTLAPAACAETTTVVVVGPYDRFTAEEIAIQIGRRGLREASLDANRYFPPHQVRLVEFVTH